MADVTLKLLADEIQTPVDYLVRQFANAGIQKSANDLVTIQEKQILLSYLSCEHNLIPDKFTLQRKTHSTLNIAGTDGKNKSVKIEIRKLRTFIKRSSQKSEHVCASKKQIKNKTQEQPCGEIKLKDKHKVIEKRKCSIVKKNEINNCQSNNLAKVPVIKSNRQERKISKENETVKLICKTKKEVYNKNEKNTCFNSFRETDDIDSYHRILNGQYVPRIKNKDNYDTESSYECSRSIKAARLAKKIIKHPELKVKKDIIDTAFYINENKCKGSNLLQQEFRRPTQAINRDILIGETITVGELANKMAVKSSQVIKIMMKLGAMVTINQVIDQETAQLVAEEMGHKVILRRENRLEEEIMHDRNINAIAESRAPVVTIMGHVDHGKTSLLDYIRSTKVASDEAGGITQRIGAYHVSTENGMITFLDTPGHSAFTAMRTRGIQITDIVVLVVAADDGVMPQTIEAIQHVKAARVPVVVAINKIDKSEADPDKIKSELAQYGIISEEWGGDCQFIYVSAKVGIGIDALLNAILIQAEVLELKAIHNGMASGVVIESFLDKGRGPVATVLIREGTLNKGDIILCGFEYGRVRAMRNELNHEITKAGPSIPVEILGLSGVPIAGDEVTVVHDEKKAREVALYRQGKLREIKLAHQKKSKLEDIFTNAGQNEIQEINIVLKADVQGSVEAISDSLLELSTDKIKIRIIGSGVGDITETDAMLAASSKAILVGFNVCANVSARRVIKAENLNLRYYSIIYNLVDEMKAEMMNLLPKIKQQNVGYAEVLNVFKSQKFGTIAGCIVTDGIIKKHNSIRILRDNVTIFEGELDSLRRFKDDVSVVRSGMECGVGIKNYNDIHIGDIIEVFEITKIQHDIN